MNCLCTRTVATWYMYTITVHTERNAPPPPPPHLQPHHQPTTPISHQLLSPTTSIHPPPTPLPPTNADPLIERKEALGKYKDINNLFQNIADFRKSKCRNYSNPMDEICTCLILPLSTPYPFALSFLTFILIL